MAAQHLRLYIYYLWRIFFSILIEFVPHSTGHLKNTEYYLLNQNDKRLSPTVAVAASCNLPTL